MRIFRTSTVCLFLLSIVFSTPLCWGQTPAPALQVQFPLPLADSTTATAVLLPSQGEEAWLVYASPGGRIGLYRLTPQTSPIPPTPIPPTPVPPTPVPQRLTIAIVENPRLSTLEQRQVMADPVWRQLAIEKHNVVGIIPTDVIEEGTGKPPALLVPFLDHAKGKPLPWCVFTDASGVILWEGPLPAIPSDLETLILKYGG